MKFDLIAPIHIYFFADLEYKKEAQMAFKKLKKREKEITGDMGFEIQEAKKLDDLNPNIVWQVYDDMFQKIVLEKYHQFQPGYDYFGAKCFKFNGNEYLNGDKNGFYPFYLNLESLTWRLESLKEEI